MKDLLIQQLQKYHPDFSETEIQKGLAYFELAGDLEGTGFCHSTFGAIKYEQNDFEGAISHFEDALAIFEQVDLKEGISYTSLNLASTLLETERYQEAIQYFKQALDILTLKYMYLPFNHGQKLV